MATPSKAPTAGGNAEQQVGDLEHNLRRMILGNVTISNAQDDQRSRRGSLQHQFQGRGRGRGRSGFFYGRGDAAAQGQPGHAQRSNESRSYAPAQDSRARGSPKLGQDSRANTHPRHSSNAPPKRIMNSWYDSRNPKQHPQHVTAPDWTPTVLQRPQAQANVHQSSVPPHLRYHGPQAPVPQQQYIQPVVNPQAQSSYLDQLATHEVSKVEISATELKEKETFRSHLESMFQKAVGEIDGTGITTINLVSFGSLASGFATKGSDMDLAVVPVWKDPPRPHESGIDQRIPRLLEKVILQAEMGARLLTRTRVPILKVCKEPTAELYQALLEERNKWDDLPEEEKYAPPGPPIERAPKSSEDAEESAGGPPMQDAQHFPSLEEVKAAQASNQANSVGPKSPSSTTTPAKNSEIESNKSDNGKPREHHQRSERPWLREKAQGPLDFPKVGVGIQCDINFENPLAIHNTQLLRCYSCCDPRVRVIVLFVKAWAKQRKVNSSYSGTLSSYGWVLMVLHYLVNIAQPPVCPNLQTHWRNPVPPTNVQDLEQIVAGYTVQFWRDEAEILRLARANQMTRNQDSVGTLLRGFFQYFAAVPQPYTFGPRPPSFHFTNEVLSLRTPGGLRLKQEKGWTGAKTTISNGKEVRHRYLFCIEDPFELDHNVARTVTHHGIVAIRDEFRRAWRILSAVGRGQKAEGGLFDEVIEVAPPTPKTPVTPGREAQGNSADSEPSVESNDGGKSMKKSDEADAAHKQTTPAGVPAQMQ